MMRSVWCVTLVMMVSAATACGVEGRKERQRRIAVQEETERAARIAYFEWPEDGVRDVATLHVTGTGTAGSGAIRIALYPELAPKTVANFQKLATQGFYEGTSFHRVIPGFMIQGGDPNTKNDDPNDDGFGDPGYKIPDEFSDAPHERGAVAMANSGRPNSGGSQFFLIHADAPHLNGSYTVFGRVIEGMDVVDAITEIDRDVTGRWGPRDRPLQKVAIERVSLERSASRRARHASQVRR